MSRARATYLHITQLERLEDWCHMVRVMFVDTPFLVGSVLNRRDYRDVDLRLILTDSKFDKLQRGRPEVIRFFNRALSTWGQIETGLPIDFQIQRATEANRDYQGERNPMGNRNHWEYRGTSGAPDRKTA